MIVANPNPAGPPHLVEFRRTPGGVQRASAALESVAIRLQGIVREAVGAQATFDHVECSVREVLLEAGRQTLALFVALQCDGDLGVTATNDLGETLHRSKTPPETLVRSTFGIHRFRQFTYSAGKNKAIELRPVSARLGLPASPWSYLLQEFAQMLTVDQAYEQAMRNLGQILGGSFSVATAEQLNGDMGAAAGEFLAALPTPEPGSEATLLVASAATWQRTRRRCGTTSI